MQRAGLSHSEIFGKFINFSEDKPPFQPQTKLTSQKRLGLLAGYVQKQPAANCTIVS